jgi:hypothetical protein
MATKEKNLILRTAAVFLVASAAFLTPASVFAQDFKLSRGQTVYVSVYSSILTAPKGVEFHLDATLIIRNTDLEDSLVVVSADFFDTEGKLLKKYFETPSILKPLETRHVYIPGESEKGGLGANFIVRWRSKKPINVPIIECVMSGTRSNQGISFVVSGQVIQEEAR